MSIRGILRSRSLAAPALSAVLSVLAIGTCAAASPHHETANQPATLGGVSRSSVEYSVPTVKLLREDGKTVALADELDDGRPVVLSFIYTTCTDLCPLSSHVLSQLQRKLGSDRDRVHLVSISIDPEEDTPARLRDYASKFGAGPGWNHYTGTVAASIMVQRAFDVYRGDKMSHAPVTLLRMAPGQPWIRFDGFAKADDLLREFHSLVAAK
jgi:protein SCO1/2